MFVRRLFAAENGGRRGRIYYTYYALALLLVLLIPRYKRQKQETTRSHCIAPVVCLPNDRRFFKDILRINCWLTKPRIALGDKKNAPARLFALLKLEGAHESAYLRQALAFNAEKFRGHVTLATPPFGKIFGGHVRTVPGNTFDKFVVRSFNFFLSY